LVAVLAMSETAAERVVRLRPVARAARVARTLNEQLRKALYKRCMVGHPLWDRWNATVDEAALRVIADGKLGVGTVPAYAADVVGMQVAYCLAVERLKKFEAMAAARGEDLEVWRREDYEHRHGAKNNEPESVPEKESA
jgi:hypothetical protein